MAGAVMARNDGEDRKSYAMLRMANALRRAIDAASDIDKERAARWAAAWGALAGIRAPAANVPGLRLRRDVLADRRAQPR